MNVVVVSYVSPSESRTVGHPFMVSTQKGGGGLEISQILLSLNNGSSACFCRWGVGYSSVFMSVKYIATFVVTLLKSFSK